MRNCTYNRSEKPQLNIHKNSLGFIHFLQCSTEEVKCAFLQWKNIRVVNVEKILPQCAKTFFFLHSCALVCIHHILIFNIRSCFQCLSFHKFSITIITFLSHMWNYWKRIMIDGGILSHITNDFYSFFRWIKGPCKNLLWRLGILKLDKRYKN